MTVEKTKEILLKEYGIHNVDELNEAIRKSPGINLGIFTTKIERKEDKDE